MVNRIFKSLDKSTARLNVPQTLLEIVGITKNDKIAICTDNYSGGIKLKPLDMVNDEKIIGIVKLDNKGRFVFPDYLLEDEDKTNLKFEIFVHNSELIVIPVN